MKSKIFLIAAFFVSFAFNTIECNENLNTEVNFRIKRWLKKKRKIAIMWGSFTSIEDFYSKFLKLEELEHAEVSDMLWFSNRRNMNVIAFAHEECSIDGETWKLRAECWDKIYNKFKVDPESLIKECDAKYEQKSNINN